MMGPDFGKAPYTAWLEDSVRELFEHDVEKIALCATLKDNRVMTAYFDCDVQDKAIMAHHINTDAMMEVVLNNIGLVKGALDEYEAQGDGCESSERE